MSRITLPPVAPPPTAAPPTARYVAGARDAVTMMAPAVIADGGVAVIRLYEEIDSWGWFGTSAAEFARVVDGLPEGIETIHLRINSPGGDVFDGVTIANTLRLHPATVRVTVDGLAASIASVIALAGDTLEMAPNSEMMIHEGWGGCRGGAADHRKYADLLDHLNDNIAGAYAEAAGGSAEDWRARMAEETWYSAAEAVEAGLADTIAQPAKAAAPAAKVFDLSTFRYHGRRQAPGPAAPAARAVAGPARSQTALIRANLRRTIA